MAYETLTMKTKVQCLFANEERGADVFQRKPFLVLTIWRCGTKGEGGGVFWTRLKEGLHYDFNLNVFTLRL